MGVWTSYLSRMEANGSDLRSASLKRELRFLRRKLPNSLSYHSVRIDGEERQVSIIDTDNLNAKKILSMPGEDITHGGLVEWAGQRWLITEKDSNTEVYAKGNMQQCNYLLRWISEDRRILERWCIIEDGTKYMIGEKVDSDLVITKGDSRIAMTIAKDAETIRLSRDNRFIIDDYASPSPLAYRLSKPFKLGGSYNGKGVLKYILSECNQEDTDYLVHHIANYYDYFPRDDQGGAADGGIQAGDGTGEDTTGRHESGRRVWL